MKHVLAFLSALAAFILISCILGGDKVAGRRGSEVENELGVYGVLVGEDGKPVAGASVKARPAAAGVGKAGAGFRVSADSDSVVTDDKGRYAFLHLPKGGYDLYGDARAGDLVVLIPDVFVRDTTRPVPVGEDTLRRPGRIAGRVVAGGRGMPAVLGYIPGTSYIAVTDDSGRFIMSGVPKGVYTVAYSAAGFLIASDSGVPVSSGKTMQLADKELDLDPALPPPAPEGLSAWADTTNGSVVLKWRPVKVHDLKAYIIYRFEPGTVPPVEIGATEDTLYRDKIRLQSGTSRSLTYVVRSIDSNANESAVYSLPAIVPIYRADWAYASLAWISPLPEILPLRESVPLIVHNHGPGSGARKLIWSDADKDSVLKVAYVDDVDATDTLMWKPGLGVRRFSVTVYNAPSKSDLSTSHSISFLPEGVKPMDLGPDQMAAFGHRVRIVSQVDSSMGPVSERGWENQSEFDFFDFERSVAYIDVPPGRDSIVCIAVVQDANLLVASDTMVIHIVRPPGLAWKKLGQPAFPPRTRTPLTPFQGRLWVIGGYSKTWRDAAIIEEHHADIWSSRDGESWTRVLEAAPFGKRSDFGAGEFSGKLWVIGGRDGNPLQDVWNSADGINWTKVADTLPFSAQIVSDVCSFQGRLWVLSFGELWSSPDGRTWRQESLSKADFSPAVQLEPRDGKIALLASLGSMTLLSDGIESLPTVLEPRSADVGMEIMAQSPEGLFLFGRMRDVPGCWKITDSGAVELVADALPFGNAELRAASFGEKLFLLETVEAGGTLRNAIWRSP
jgi:hypothetical protein